MLFAWGVNLDAKSFVAEFQLPTSMTTGYTNAGFYTDMKRSHNAISYAPDSYFDVGLSDQMKLVMGFCIRHSSALHFLKSIGAQIRFTLELLEDMVRNPDEEYETNFLCDSEFAEVVMPFRPMLFFRVQIRTHERLP